VSSVFILFDLTSAAKILTLTITPTAASKKKPLRISGFFETNRVGQRAINVQFSAVVVL
jgi:hypothetical protein